MKRFPITSGQIDTLVAVFYERIRNHPDLGPVFLRAIGTSDENWRAHEARIASFWRNATGLDRSFSGNPMLKHLANKEVVPEQFSVWLDLFRHTAMETLPSDTAAGISALADRIGRSLSMGIRQMRHKNDTPELT